MIPYAVQEISTKDGFRYDVHRNNWVYNNSQTDWSYDIAPKYTDEMIADGDTLTLSYNRQVKGTYYIQFAVIPYENTFDLAVNIFKSQQGDIGDNPTDMVTTEYVDNAVSGKVSGSSVGQAPAILSATSVYASDWATLSSTADENTMYVVLPDPVFPTRVKYTAASGLPDWEGDIDGVIQGGGDEEATTQIPNVFNAEEVLIGSNVTGLNDYAFMYCSSLKSVTIGNGVTSIDGGALAETGLSSITIPSNVTTIGFNVFKNCKALTSVTFEGFTKNEVKDMTTGEDKIFGDCFTDNGEPI